MSTRPGIGWPLLPLPDEQGRLRWPGLEQSVEEGIRIVLSTAPGERLMRPEFGAGLERFVHENNTLTVRRRIHDAIHESLTRHEPRLVLDLVEVKEVEGRPTHVRVEVHYRVRRTGEARRQGLTLEVRG